ncbi:MAG: VPLPA-CTERM sorting domain-containing protein [Acetobacteraceae bacterium]
MKFPFALAAVLLAATSLPAASAEAAAYSFTSAPVAVDTQLSLGFTFTANTTFNVTSLGYYDDLGDGFLTAHDVGIFQGDGASGPGPLLASTTLAAGTSGTLGPNDFRYQAIAPLTLTAGQTYTIAGLSPNVGVNDAWVYGGPSEVTGFSVDPDITIPLDAARYIYFPPGGVLTDPSDHFSDYQFYAVNFNGPTAIPEPAALALLLVGMGGLAAAKRKRG